MNSNADPVVTEPARWVNDRNARIRYTKLINAALLITSLFGYLQWGPNKMFLFEMEAGIMSKMFTNPLDIVHPFTVLPMLGQLFLLMTLFQKNPSKYLTIAGVLCMALLLGFIFLIGVISLSWKLTLSTLPFVVVAVIQLIFVRR